jgi:toxin ParE1/3/4
VVPSVKKTPQAKQDLLEHVLYLAEINPDLADRFIDASEMAFEKLAQMPLKGKPQSFQSPKLKGVRRWFIPGFDKYLVFYRPIKGGIELLRVLHGMQDVATVMDKA